MNIFRLLLSQKKNPVLMHHVRSFCERVQSFEKSINQVILLGRVGIDPQLRGSDENQVLIFTLATNSHFKYDSEIRQKTEWHRVSVFREHLRNSLNHYMKKGCRVFVQGKILYGEVKDIKGVSHTTTTIVADDVVFLDTPSNREKISETD